MGWAVGCQPSQTAGKGISEHRDSAGRSHLVPAARAACPYRNKQGHIPTWISSVLGPAPGPPDEAEQRAYSTAVSSDMSSGRWGGTCWTDQAAASACGTPCATAIRGDETGWSDTGRSPRDCRLRWHGCAACVGSTRCGRRMAGRRWVWLHRRPHPGWLHVAGRYCATLAAERFVAGFL